MWPFKRSKADNGKKVPSEVKQYYDSEHRERVGLAWLIALLSLIVTIAVIAGLFFGGRWVYRKVANRNKPSTTGQAPTEQPAPAATPSSPNTTSKPNDLQPAAPSQNQPNSSSNSSSPSSSSNQKPSSSSSNSSSSSSSSSEGKITNTGPGSTVTIFLGVTAVATTAHLIYQRRKLTNKLSS